MNLQSLSVEFPLQGEWTAYHTPADKVPSHGTDQLAQRYAFDLLRIDRSRSGWRFHGHSSWRYWLRGVPLKACYGWREPIFSPFSGTVVKAHDGWAERNPVFWACDLGVVVKNAASVTLRNIKDLRPITGNHIILQAAASRTFALIAHASTGSVKVKAGEIVIAGQHIADVGHSGNSTLPHLHFQLMDGPDPITATGLPCSFKRYQSFRDGAWSEVRDGIPGKREFIRHHLTLQDSSVVEDPAQAAAE